MKNHQLLFCLKLFNEKFGISRLVYQEGVPLYSTPKHQFETWDKGRMETLADIDKTTGYLDDIARQIPNVKDKNHLDGSQIQQMANVAKAKIKPGQAFSNLQAIIQFFEALEEHADEKLFPKAHKFIEYKLGQWRDFSDKAGYRDSHGIRVVAASALKKANERLSTILQNHLKEPQAAERNEAVAVNERDAARQIIKRIADRYPEDQKIQDAANQAVRDFGSRMPAEVVADFDSSVATAQVGYDSGSVIAMFERSLDHNLSTAAGVDEETPLAPQPGEDAVVPRVQRREAAAEAADAEKTKLPSPKGDGFKVTS